jgi:hypothetical protein
MVVPVLWAFEVANSLLVLWRRRVIQQEQYERARWDLAHLESTVDEDGPQLALEKDFHRRARAFAHVV